MAQTTTYVQIPETTQGTNVVIVGATAAEPTTTSVETEELPAPPPYQQSTETEEADNSNDTTPLVSSEGALPAPPAYNIATDLPTYEEAERSKAAEEEQRQVQERENQRTLIFGWLRTRETRDDGMLGTDSIFVCTFLLAFIFNWLGLLASLCVTQTIAGRLGALSGFGLSLVKYMLLFSHSGFGASLHGMDTVVWWLLVAVGFLLFFRGISQYIRVKYSWPNLSSENRRSMFNHYY